MSKMKNKTKKTDQNQVEIYSKADPKCLNCPKQTHLTQKLIKMDIKLTKIYSRLTKFDLKIGKI